MNNDEINNNTYNTDEHNKDISSEHAQNAQNAANAMHEDEGNDDDDDDIQDITTHLTEPQTDISVEDLYHHNWHIGANTKYRHKHMSNYVYTSHNNVDIIDLAKVRVVLRKTLTYLRNAVMKGKRVLFVGTNTYASKAIAEHAERCGQYYISKKWFGGLLTNWQTFSDSIKKMNALHKMIEEDTLPVMTKKERLAVIRKVTKHRSFMHGVKDMESVPNIVIIASPREKTAISEAKRMSSLPLTSILLADTNTDPSEINIVIPGNAASIKAVDYFCRLCANACLQGLMDEEKLIKAHAETAAQEGASEQAAENSTPSASSSVPHATYRSPYQQNVTGNAGHANSRPYQQRTPSNGIGGQSAGGVPGQTRRPFGQNRDGAASSVVKREYMPRPYHGNRPHHPTGTLPVKTHDGMKPVSAHGVTHGPRADNATRVGYTRRDSSNQVRYHDGNASARHTGQHRFPRPQQTANAGDATNTTSNINTHDIKHNTPNVHPKNNAKALHTDTTEHVNAAPTSEPKE
jgi:small subunit ribosomal protein S2